MDILVIALLLDSGTLTAWIYAQSCDSFLFLFQDLRNQLHETSEREHHWNSVPV